MDRRGGGLLTASAAPSTSGEASSTVPIVPCRFLDTRSSTGERTSPLGADETVTLLAFGAHGGCTIPDAATALVANVTTVNQSNSGYLTVFPADADRPTISVLNWSANDGAIGNEVTTKLSAAGSFSVYNFAGTADVVIDVVAYLVPASSGTGPNGNTGDVGQTGAVGPQGAPGIQGNPGAAGADAGTKFKMSFANPAGGSVTGQFFVASDWALTALCLNYGVNNQEVYIGVVVNGAPITVATNSPYTSTYASESAQALPATTSWHRV